MRFEFVIVVTDCSINIIDHNALNDANYCTCHVSGLMYAPQLVESLGFLMMSLRCVSVSGVRKSTYAALSLLRVKSDDDMSASPFKIMPVKVCLRYVTKPCDIRFMTV